MAEDGRSLQNSALSKNNWTNAGNKKAFIICSYPSKEENRKGGRWRALTKKSFIKEFMSNPQSFLKIKICNKAVKKSRNGEHFLWEIERMGMR